jgi:hypothetical protein
MKGNERSRTEHAAVAYWADAVHQAARYASCLKKKKKAATSHTNSFRRSARILASPTSAQAHRSSDDEAPWTSSPINRGKDNWHRISTSFPFFFFCSEKQPNHPAINEISRRNWTLCINNSYRITFQPLERGAAEKIYHGMIPEQAKKKMSCSRKESSRHAWKFMSPSNWQ